MAKINTVRDSRTNAQLDGSPNEELVRESLAEDTGAVCAYLEDGVWHYVRSDQEDHYRRNLGVDVKVVWVEQTEGERNLEVELDTAVGPRVRVWGEWDIEEVEASLPGGWTVGDNWGNGVKTDSGGWSYPLVRVG